MTIARNYGGPRRTGEIMNTRIASALLCLSLLVGCASPVTVAGMTVTPDKVATPPVELASAVDVGGVSGGRDSGGFGTTHIGNDVFKEALEASLRGAGLLGDTHARYVVEAKIVDIDSPSGFLPVFNARVTSRIRYTVIEKSTKRVVFDETIEAAHVSRMSDNWVGSERVRLANQGSARKSIASLIAKLESAPLSPRKAVAGAVVYDRTARSRRAVISSG